MEILRRHWKLALPAALTLAVLLWAGLAPIHIGARDALFDIPKGTWARRMAGDKVEILPNTIYLTLGVRDVLHLKNNDTVPQTFGPVLLMPGMEFSLPFEQESENQFACTAHASGQMTVIVQAMPDPGWPRLRWRVENLLHHFA